MKDDDLLAAIESGYETAPLDDRRKAMLNYAVKLTRSPAAIVQQDVQQLQDAGFSDLDILHIAEVTAYYAYVNRIADGLGVMLEE